MNLRLRILKKFAQEANQEAAKVVSPVPNFVASNEFPNISYAFESTHIPQINQIASLLNQALHYATEGKVNFTILKSNNFTSNTAQFQTTYLKNLYSLSKLFYDYILKVNSNKLNKQNISQIVEYIKNSSFLTGMGNVDFTNTSSKYIPTDLRTKIFNTLSLIK